MGRRIPQGWQELEFQDFLKFTPREVDKPKGQYRSLGIRSHCKGTFIREIENPDKVMMETLYAVKKNDLIVNITFAWEGAVALVKESDEGALVSHRFPTYVFDRNAVIPEFFQYLIPSKRFVYNLGIISPGGAGRNRVLDRKDFLHLQFITPPVEEQKKIAKILSTWDRAIETLDKLIEAQTRLKKGLMQKLLNSKAKATRLKNIAEIIFSNVDKKSYSDQRQVYLCNYLDVYNNTYITSKLLFMKATASEAEINKFGLKEGDVIITKDSETPEDIGVPAVVVEKLKGVICGYHLAIIRPDVNKINPVYLAKELTTLRIKKQFYKYANGATRFGLGTGDIGKIEIVVPKLEDQEKISRLFQSMDRETSLFAMVRKHWQSQKQGLMQKLLTGKVRISPATSKDGTK